MINVTEWLIPGLWLAWAVYWWKSSYGVKRVVRQESALSRAAHFVPLVVAAVLLSVKSVPGWLGTRWIESGWVVFFVGVTLVIAGLLFSVWARIVLGDNWSASVTLKQHHEIVRTGPYRWIRHPIYTGLVLAFLGSAVARGEWRGMLAFVIVVIALWRKLRLEERWLEEFFGADYANYRQSSWALVPFVL
jgi:protein-S-isoprenylcysteine O-methyltransferase Ste14